MMKASAMPATLQVATVPSENALMDEAVNPAAVAMPHGALSAILLATELPAFALVLVNRPIQ